MKDAHGNVVGLTDASGSIVVTYSYDAWGNERSSSGAVMTGDNSKLLKDANPFRYSSYYFDETSGLYYLKARYYSPELGRFLSRDPIPGNVANSIWQNRYTYVWNCPVKYVDPDGTYGYTEEMMRGDIDGDNYLAKRSVAYGDYMMTSSDHALDKKPSSEGGYSALVLAGGSAAYGVDKYASGGIAKKLGLSGAAAKVVNNVGAATLVGGAIAVVEDLSYFEDTGLKITAAISDGVIYGGAATVSMGLQGTIAGLVVAASAPAWVGAAAVGAVAIATYYGASYLSSNMRAAFRDADKRRLR